ncbi:MAG: SDR family oxidoreductase [Actinobacteria bacterium]|nr:SDR family oxidoreductase [Actinomycetota bacterium]
MDLVTGSTGFIGGVLVRELIKRGRKVRAFMRSTSDAARLRGLPVERVAGSLMDQQSLYNAFRGIDTVYHMAARVSIMPWEEKLMRSTNLEGTRNIIKACMKCGVKKLVYTSSIHALKEPPCGKIIDESMPFDPGNRRGEYDRAKAVSSMEVINMAGDGLFTVVLCPTGTLGPYDWRLSAITRTFLDYYHGKLKMKIEGAYDFVDVRDVALGHILAAEKGKPGQSYILSGERVTMDNMFKMLEEETGIPAPEMRVPLYLVRAACIFSPAYYRISGKTPRFTSYSINTLHSNSLISHEKASQELGYNPRPIKESIKDTFRWLYDAGFIS